MGCWQSSQERFTRHSTSDLTKKCFTFNCCQRLNYTNLFFLSSNFPLRYDTLHQTIFVTLNVVICDPTFFKHHEDHHPKGVWKKKLVWKDEWVKDYKTEKQASEVVVIVSLSHSFSNSTSLISGKICKLPLLPTDF